MKLCLRYYWFVFFRTRCSVTHSRVSSKSHKNSKVCKNIFRLQLKRRHRDVIKPHCQYCTQLDVTACDIWQNCAQFPYQKSTTVVPWFNHGFLGMVLPCGQPWLTMVEHTYPQNMVEPWYFGRVETSLYLACRHSTGLEVECAVYGFLYRYRYFVFVCFIVFSVVVIYICIFYFCISFSLSGYRSH